jgi:hypothetical protein
MITPTHELWNGCGTEGIISVRVGQEFSLRSDLPVFSGKQFLESEVREMEKKGDLLGLPDEISLHIVSFLDVASIGRLSRVNRHFASLLREDSVWRSLFHHFWDPRQPRSDDAKDYYTGAIGRRI